METCKNFCRKLNRTKKLDSHVMDTELRRCLTTLDITFLGVGHMVGAGIYVLSGAVAKNMAGPAVILSFVLAGIACVLASLCYAEFGARVPKAGSAYVYGYVTIGEIWAFIIGWDVVLEQMIGAASVAKAWSGYMDSITGGHIQNGTMTYIGGFHAGDFISHSPDFLAFGLCLVIGALLSFGMKEASMVNSLFTCVNLAVITFVTCYGLSWANFDNWTRNGFMPNGFQGVVAGGASCFFAFSGFETIATSGEESKNPSRSIPLATFFAMAITSVAYIAVSASLTLMVYYKDIDPKAAFAEAFAYVGVEWARYLVAVGALCGMTTSLFGSLFALPRVVYAMANDGLLFEFFAWVNHKTQTPIINLIVCSVFTGLIALIFEIEKLVEFMSIGTLMAYSIVSASVIILRYQPENKIIKEELELGAHHQTNGHDTKELDAGKGSSVEATEKSRPVAAGTVQPTFTILRWLDDYFPPGSVVTGSVMIMSLFMLLSWSLMRIIPTQLGSGVWWAVLIQVLLVSVVFVCIFLICAHQQNGQKLTFTVPLVPVLPALSVCFNVYLMTNLEGMTWIRFAVWLAIGLCIYLFYGVHHSKNDADDVAASTDTLCTRTPSIYSHPSVSNLPTVVAGDSSWNYYTPPKSPS